MTIDFAGALAATAAAIALTGPAAAQETTLKLASFLPSTHFGVTEGSDVFAERLSELTDGQVEVEFYPAEQAGKAKQLLELVRVGALDMAEIGTGYVSSDDIPLLGYLEVPGLVESVCAGTRASRAIGDPGGVVYENAYGPLGIRVISYYVYSPYGPAGSRVAISEVDDLQGLKMRNAGGLMEMTVGALGGVPMKLTAPEVLTGLQRGTVDSYMGSYLSVAAYEYDAYAKYGATGFSMGTPGVFAVISESRYQSLPEDVRAAVDQAGREAEQNFCAYSDENEARIIEEMQADGRMEIHTWTEEQVAELRARTASVAEDWVSTLEGRGLPAERTLADFTAALSGN